MSDSPGESDAAARIAAPSAADAGDAGDAVRVYSGHGLGRVPLVGTGVASDHAARLLADLGREVVRRDGAPDPSPAADWARSGAMWLTGSPDAPPLLAPGPFASAARGALAALAALLPASARTGLRDIDAPALLGERAALFGLGRRGSVSPSGTCRLLATRSGWLAVNLARDDDRRALPAWLEDDALGIAHKGDGERLWERLAEVLAGWERDAALERARWLGLPVAPAVCAGAPPPWLRATRAGEATRTRRSRPPRVLDLSSLWAGPLATHLLQCAGARVVKLESVGRPDGARSGAPAFFDLLHGGKRCVALDLTASEGRAHLRALVAWADIVVESARPRALRQLGLVAEDVLAARPGLTWLSITGYGRRDPEGQWVAFGDDAAVAAGVASALCDAHGVPRFCGDALADPLTGLHAALAAWASFDAGGGHLLDVSLRDVTACLLGVAQPEVDAQLREGPDGFVLLHDGGPTPVARPRVRTPSACAAALGADTAAVLAGLQPAC